MLAFLNTKKDTSDARQRKFKRVLGIQTSFLEERYGINPLITPSVITQNRPYVIT